MAPRKILLKDLNPCITCSLCGGYIIDATSLVECFHVFCRACILRHFETRLTCPTCNIICKRKTNHPCFRPDPIIQSLVYKLVPGLYSREVQRREDFYRGSGVRAGSSCSEDSALGDLNEEHDEWLQSTLNEQNMYLSPDDAISLSLEFYQAHLDHTKETKNLRDVTNRGHRTELIKSVRFARVAKRTRPSDLTRNENATKCDVISDIDVTVTERRYLQCPAAVTMSHLQKFLRMKYAVSAEHRVDLIYAGEVLPTNFSLMDVAYTFRWKRTEPLRFFYRIFTPVKIQPIKIINTSSLIGGKQLQVVPAKFQPFVSLVSTDLKSSKLTLDKQLQKDKEHLMANLQLKSKPQSPCVYEYEEPDHDEIREFAARRDREWALQKQLDEEKERKNRKRKKKEKKNGPMSYKKRKFHAEITSSDSVQREEGLKLKVKLTPHNGYKHKHHKSSSPTSKTPPSPSDQEQLTSKEKLLQMRQVRHKHSHHKDEIKSDVINNNSVTPTTSTKPINSEGFIAKTLRSDFAFKTKEIGKPTGGASTIPSTSKETIDKQTFLKTFQSYTEKKSNGNLDQKLANLYQKEKKLTMPFSSPFTVSKVEVGMKKEPTSPPEKRPSLEITLIPTPQNGAKTTCATTLTTTTVATGTKTVTTPSTKRPPPPTIPLERIRKSYALNHSQISIIPRSNDKCDKSGALDLSKSKSTGLLNGVAKPSQTIDRNLANLQMLSKVALNEIGTKKPPIPNLQTIKIPQPITHKTIPKLNEIGKGFRLNTNNNNNGGQIRNMRPNQNQSVRNIPNPSLIVRQQNQNRINSMNTTTTVAPTSTTITTVAVVTMATAPTVSTMITTSVTNTTPVAAVAAVAATPTATVAPSVGVADEIQAKEPEKLTETEKPIETK